MRSLIGYLLGGLSPFGNSLVDLFVKGFVHVQDFLTEGEETMRNLVNFFGGLRIRVLNPLMAGVVAFAFAFGIVAHLDAQSLQFVEKGRYPIGEGPNGIAAGDLNGDGNLDLVTPCYDTNRVAVVLGDGTGAFGAPSFYTAEYRPTATPVLADFNGDGNLDAAITTMTLRIFLRCWEMEQEG